MATATVQRRHAPQRREVKEFTFLWEGIDRNNRNVRGEMKAASETVVTTQPAPPGHPHHQAARQTFRGGRQVNEKDITFFTRQLATMLKAGVPLLQAFEIVARGHSNARFARLMMDIKGRVEAGSSLSQAFREHPAHFDALYCNLVNAGETAGMLDGILERLATYKEKILAIKSKIKSALVLSDLGRRGRDRRHLGDHDLGDSGVQAGLHELRRQPAGAHADRHGHLGLLRLLLVADRRSSSAVAIFGFFFMLRRSQTFRYTVDRISLKLPVIGPILEKATIARWTRTLATMFAAGVPLVESLDAVAGASGNAVYIAGTRKIQTEVSTGRA